MNDKLVKEIQVLAGNKEVCEKIAQAETFEEIKDIFANAGVEITDEPIQLTQGFTSDMWKGVDINVSDGWVSMIMANGNLAVGFSSDGSVPEPSSLLLLLSGFTLLGVRRIFRKKC